MKSVKNVAKIVAGVVLVLVGASGIVGGLMLCITIIGIVPGILIMFGGTAIMFSGVSLMGGGSVLNRLGRWDRARKARAAARQ